MLNLVHAISLRIAAGLAFALAIFLWVLPLSLYEERIWLLGPEDLACFLVVSALLSLPLVIAGASSWRRSGELGRPGSAGESSET